MTVLKWISPAIALVLMLALASRVNAQAVGIDEPYMAEIPNACDHLPTDLAAELLRAGPIASAANEHIPTFWSQCHYSGKNVIKRNTGVVFKFAVWDLFDLKTLHPMQVEFNASFAVGGLKPLQTHEDMGKVAYDYVKDNRSVLLVITGFQGPPDGAKRPTELIAEYYLADSETPHPVRLEKLLLQARADLEQWNAGS